MAAGAQMGSSSLCFVSQIDKILFQKKEEGMHMDKSIKSVLWI